jgi:hypothetical protein
MSTTEQRLRTRRFVLGREPSIVESGSLRERLGEELWGALFEAASAHPQFVLALSGVFVEDWAPSEVYSRD